MSIAMETSMLASVGRMLWRYLDAHRVDADALFKRCGLDPSLIQEPRTRYPFRRLCKAFVEASLINGDENMGLELAKFYNPLDLNALGVTFLSSETLVKAFRRLVRYESVVNSNLMLSIAESDGQTHLISELPDAAAGAALQIVEDARMAVLVDLCRLGLGSSLDPVEVAFTHPEPKSTGNHFGVFRCPVVFCQPASRISFNITDAQQPFTAANRELAVSSDRILEGMIKDLNQSEIINQVKRAIIDNLPSGTPSDEDIARQLHVSSRTLQRRLAENGTNFRTLVLQVRRGLAEKYIADKHMPLVEISYMLGFSDTSSFSRAFKQWTGNSPTIFRKSVSS
jgi:AraC-like DNA-binding protein